MPIQVSHISSTVRLCNTVLKSCYYAFFVSILNVGGISAAPWISRSVDADDDDDKVGQQTQGPLRAVKGLTSYATDWCVKYKVYIEIMLCQVGVTS